MLLALVRTNLSNVSPMYDFMQYCLLVNTLKNINTTTRIWIHQVDVENQ